MKPTLTESQPDQQQNEPIFIGRIGEYTFLESEALYSGLNPSANPKGFFSFLPKVMLEVQGPSLPKMDREKISIICSPLKGKQSKHRKPAIIPSVFCSIGNESEVLFASFKPNVISIQRYSMQETKDSQPIFKELEIVNLEEGDSIIPGSEIITDECILAPTTSAVLFVPLSSGTIIAFSFIKKEKPGYPLQRHLVQTRNGTSSRFSCCAFNKLTPSFFGTGLIQLSFGTLSGSIENYLLKLPFGETNTAEFLESFPVDLPIEGSFSQFLNKWATFLSPSKKEPIRFLGFYASSNIITVTESMRLALYEFSRPHPKRMEKLCFELKLVASLCPEKQKEISQLHFFPMIKVKETSENKENELTREKIQDKKLVVLCRGEIKTSFCKVFPLKAEEQLNPAHLDLAFHPDAFYPIQMEVHKSLVLVVFQESSSLNQSVQCFNLQQGGSIIKVWFFENRLKRTESLFRFLDDKIAHEYSSIHKKLNRFAYPEQKEPQGYHHFMSANSDDPWSGISHYPHELPKPQSQHEEMNKPGEIEGIFFGGGLTSTPLVARRLGDTLSLSFLAWAQENEVISLSLDELFVSALQLSNDPNDWDMSQIELNRPGFLENFNEEFDELTEAINSSWKRVVTFGHGPHQKELKDSELEVISEKSGDSEGNSSLEADWVRKRSGFGEPKPKKEGFDEKQRVKMVDPFEMVLFRICKDFSSCQFFESIQKLKEHFQAIPHRRLYTRNGKEKVALVFQMIAQEIRGFFTRTAFGVQQDWEPVYSEKDVIALSDRVILLLHNSCSLLGKMIVILPTLLSPSDLEAHSIGHTDLTECLASLMSLEFALLQKSVSGQGQRVIEKIIREMDFPLRNHSTSYSTWLNLAAKSLIMEISYKFPLESSMEKEETFEKLSKYLEPRSFETWSKICSVEEPMMLWIRFVAWDEMFNPEGRNSAAQHLVLKTLEANTQLTPFTRGFLRSSGFVVAMVRAVQSLEISKFFLKVFPEGSEKEIMNAMVSERLFRKAWCFGVENQKKNKGFLKAYFLAVSEGSDEAFNDSKQIVLKYMCSHGPVDIEHYLEPEIALQIMSGISADLIRSLSDDARTIQSELLFLERWQSIPLAYFAGKLASNKLLPFGSRFFLESAIQASRKALKVLNLSVYISIIQFVRENCIFSSQILSTYILTQRIPPPSPPSGFLGSTLTGQNISHASHISNARNDAMIYTVEIQNKEFWSLENIKGMLAEQEAILFLNEKGVFKHGAERPGWLAARNPNRVVQELLSIPGSEDVALWLAIMSQTALRTWKDHVVTTIQGLQKQQRKFKEMCMFLEEKKAKEKIRRLKNLMEEGQRAEEYPYILKETLDKLRF